MDPKTTAAPDAASDTAGKKSAPKTAPAEAAATETPPPQKRVRVLREQPVWDGGFHHATGTDFNTSAERAEILAREGTVKILGLAE